MRFSSRKIILISSLIVSTSTGTIIRVPQDQLTIQAGIDAAVDGDTVLVDSGRYVENINFKGKNIAVGSLFLTTGNPFFIHHTVITNEYETWFPVRFAGREDDRCSLSGFTIRESIGAIHFSNSASPVISHCIMEENSTLSHFYMGVVECYDSSPTIVHCTIVSNFEVPGQFGLGWGIVSVGSSRPKIINTTIAGNTTFYGGGIQALGVSQPFVINSIIWNNGGASVDSLESTPVVAFSNIEGGWNGEWNIDADPLFIDPENGNFQLEPSSPCIDAGTAFFVWQGDTLVNFPDSVYQGSAPDIGALESSFGLEYFPLNIGDERQYYYVQSPGDTVLSPIKTVSDTISIDGKTYFSYSTDFLWVPSQYVRTDENGNVLMYFENEEGEPDETILFKFNVAEGDSYSTKPVFLGGSHFVVTAVSRNDTVISRAGSFPNCIQLWFQVPNAVDEDLWYWFAPEVGIVAIASEWYPISPLYYAKVGATIYPPGSLGLSKLQPVLPREYRLETNYPNPFNPTTTIQYDLPRSGHVSLTIYDLLGRQVEVAVSKWQGAGKYSVVWDATGVPSGIYFVRMISGDPSRSSGQVFSQVRKVMVLR